MTPDQLFHRFLVHPSTGPRLDGMLAESRAIDLFEAEIDERRRREMNDEVYQRAVKTWFDAEGTR